MAVATGPLPEGSGVTAMGDHYEAVRGSADKIADILIQRSGECRDRHSDLPEGSKRKGKIPRKNKSESRV